MLSKELLEKTVAEAIDITRNQYAKTDSVYKMELENLEKLLREYEDLPLEKEVRSRIDAYIQSLEKLDGRYADLSYIAGIRDACFWAAKIGLLGIDLEKDDYVLKWKKIAQKRKVWGHLMMLSTLFFKIIKRCQMQIYCHRLL